MIVINYDPIFGCVGWDFGKPERVPLTTKEKGEIIHNFFNGNRGEKMLGYLTKTVPNTREKKQNTYTWDIMCKREEEEEDDDN